MSLSSPESCRLSGSVANDYAQADEIGSKVSVLCEGGTMTGTEPAELGESITYECLRIPISLHSNARIVSKFSPIEQ